MDTLVVALRVLLSLAAVLGLVWWLQRRLTRGRAPKANPVTVVTRQSIGQKASVVIVDVEGSRLVLGVTEHGVSVLQSAEAPEQLEPAVAFAAKLEAVKTSTVTDASPSPASTLTPALPSGAQLAGSILSLDTWKQAAATLRRAR